MTCLKIKTPKKNKKYKPPIHWEDDRQRINVGSKYFIFLKVEKPVPVNPESDSKTALKKVNLKLLK